MESPARTDGPVLHGPDWDTFVRHYPELSDLTITAFLEEFRLFLERVVNGTCPLDPAVLQQLCGGEDTPVSPHGHSPAHSCQDSAEPQRDGAVQGARNQPLADPMEDPLLSPRWQPRVLLTRLKLPSAQAPPAPQQRPTCTEAPLQEVRCSRPTEPATAPRAQAPADAHRHPSCEEALVQEALKRQPRVLLTRLKLPLGLGSCQGMPTLPEVGSSPAQRPLPARTRTRSRTRSCTRSRSQQDSSQQDRSPPRKRRRMELRQRRKR